MFCSLCTDLRWIGIKHHKAKFLGADAAEEDVEGVTGGHKAVEERHPLLAGVARTPTVVLRTWTQGDESEDRAFLFLFQRSHVKKILLYQ